MGLVWVDGLTCLGSPTMRICPDSTDSTSDPGKVCSVHILGKVKSRPLRQSPAVFSPKGAELPQSDLVVVTGCSCDSLGKARLVCFYKIILH